MIIVLIKIIGNLILAFAYLSAAAGALIIAAVMLYLLFVLW